MMRTRLATFVVLILIASAAFGSAYQASPKLVVILIIDQFRGDYLERYHDEFGPSGFRTFTDRGAYFPACYYRDDFHYRRLLRIHVMDLGMEGI